MTNRVISFGFNHMVRPSLTPEELVDAAIRAGAVAIELRNDIGGNSLRRPRYGSPRRRQGRGSPSRNSQRQRPLSVQCLERRARAADRRVGQARRSVRGDRSW